MSKLKTHKSIQKRIRISGSGKLISRKMSITHRSRFKSKRAKNAATKTVTLISTVARKLKKVLV